MGWNKRGAAEFIRGLCRRLGTFKKTDLKEETWDNYIDWSQVGSVLRDFLKSGEIRKVEPILGSGEPGQVFEYVGPKLRGFGVREKVLRAMHVKGMFTIRDITVLSDGEHSYVCALLRKLVKAGELEHAGKAPGPRRPEAAYRVKNRDQFFLKWVKGPQESAKADPPWRRKTKGIRP